ncbi:hypothetical protein [Dyella silvatica]|uniref:hypothetical protein n=1 Tax=Dyella silvatica TaxID=2992128 RepID=UPI002254082A|nr:hypothetical protein [Dyella silvatica]
MTEKTKSTWATDAAATRLPGRRWLLPLALVLIGTGLLCLTRDERWLHGLGGALLGLAMVLGYLDKMVRSGPRQVDKRYRREFTAAMTAYVLTMLFVWPLQKQTDQTWVVALIALLPMLPLSLLIRAMVRLVLGSDELQRRLHLEALAIASGVIGLLSMALGFQIAAKVITLDGTILFMVYPGLCFVYGLARCWTEWRYRTNE